MPQSDPSREVIYAIDKNIIAGHQPKLPDGMDLFSDEYARWSAEAPGTPVLGWQEAVNILMRRVVLHHTYSMQQSDFARAGFEVMESPWRVVLPAGVLVVGIGTRDRYDIFAGSPELHQFDTVEEWREGRDAEAEGWARRTVRKESTDAV